MHEHSRLVAGQAADRQHRQVGAVEQRRLTLTDGDQDGDRVGHQSAEGEQQRLCAGAVEPLGVVHQHRHWCLLGVGRKQAEHRGAHREPLLRRTGPQRQRGLQRGRLGPRDLPKHGQRGPDQLKQGSEGDLRLRLDAARTQ
jgi:hypothetical protein